MTYDRRRVFQRTNIKNTSIKNRLKQRGYKQDIKKLAFVSAAHSNYQNAILIDPKIEYQVLDFFTYISHQIPIEKIRKKFHTEDYQDGTYGTKFGSGKNKNRFLARWEERTIKKLPPQKQIQVLSFEDTRPPVGFRPTI